MPGLRATRPQPVRDIADQAQGHARRRRKAGPLLGLGEPPLTTLPHRGTTSHRAETDHCVAVGCAGQGEQDSKRPKRTGPLFAFAGEGFDLLDSSKLYVGR